MKKYSREELEALSYHHLMNILKHSRTKKRARELLDVIAFKFGKMRYGTGTYHLKSHSTEEENETKNER